MSSSIGELCQMNERVSSFPPLVGRAPRVLVLGSMPGLRSLQAARYYAHPHNAFWPIMGQLLGFEGGADYDTRCRALTAAGVALWDVMASCERRGSLDSAIVRSSVQPNDIAALLEREPGIRAILFNGAAAEQGFVRHVLPGLGARAGIDRLRLPSTSPAHAGLDRRAKLAAWRNALAPYLPLSG